MKLPKHIILGLVGILCSIGSAVVTMLSYEDKRKEIERQVDKKVDQRFSQFVASATSRIEEKENKA